MAKKLYTESRIAAIAENLRLKSDGSSEQFTTAQMSEAVLRLPYANIPSYHKDEAKRLIQKICEFKAAHPNNIIFGAMSDNHVYRNSEEYSADTERSTRHAAYALDTVGVVCDFTVNLGDNCWENGIDTDNAAEAEEYLKNATESCTQTNIMYHVVGNHDTSGTTLKTYGFIGCRNEFDEYGAEKTRGFGYKDYPDKKVRVIVLNTSDYMNVKGGHGMSYDQKDYLIRALDLSEKDNTEEWQILILSHFPVDFAGGDYNIHDDLQAILNAYTNGTAVSIPVNSSYAKNEDPTLYETYSDGALVWNYSGKNQAKIIANIHGHVHTNAYGRMSGTNILRMATPNSCFHLNKTDSYPDSGDYGISAEEAAMLVKSDGSEKDTSVTFYCIALDEHTIYAYGYGANSDRTAVYGEAETYSVTYNLTNCASSNTADIAAEGSSFSTTITLWHSKAVLESITVTMGDNDITESVRSGSDISIPEVTGNIVITASAVIPIVWDISDRTPVTGVNAGPSDKKSIEAGKYYIGAASTGGIYPTRISGVSVNGNDVTFTSSEKAIGIGLPYHLKANTSYTISCKATASARLRVFQLNPDGTFVSGSETYSSSGTALTHTFTAPSDETLWTVILLDTNTVGTSITYTDIVLSEN